MHIVKREREDDHVGWGENTKESKHEERRDKDSRGCSRNFAHEASEKNEENRVHETAQASVHATSTTKE